jgi:valine--pyruvate aminotransferase
MTGEAMSWEMSEFGRRLSSRQGIGELMDDLGRALATGSDTVRMLGGGQPAHIPEIDKLWHQRIRQICDSPGELEHVLGNYEPPAGNHKFRKGLANLFEREFGWAIGPENICVTAGGQTAFFLLLNSLAGQFSDGRYKQVLFPLVPEYIGYSNQSVGGDLFCAVKPRIELDGEHQFKYHVDFDALHVGDNVAAICVSRPTNPSGNVLTDVEITRLSDLATANDIPLIIDNAYGAPFPGAIFTDATPIWNQNIILTLSLSKLGLPATRTGIVVAREDLIGRVASMTSVFGLANTNLGQALVAPLVESGEILRLSNEIIQPYYLAKSRQAIKWVGEIFPDSIPYRVHRSEGAFFLWLWFDGLPITSRELYERLKRRDVLVVPGSECFFGSDDDRWRHRDECLRVTFTMPEEAVYQGLIVIAEEVAKAYDQGN